MENILLSGEVGEDITLLGVIEATKDRTKKYNFIIDSVGGYVDEGYAIAKHIEGLDAVTTAKKVYSIATVIYLAGRERYVNADSVFMIHNPWYSGAAGDKDALRMYADELEKTESDMETYYMQKTGINKDSISSLMQQETYFTGQTALNLGFATSFDNAVRAVAKLNLNKSENKNEKRMENDLIGALRNALGLKQKAQEQTEAPDAAETPQSFTVLSDEDKASIAALVFESISPVLAEMKEKAMQKQDEQLNAIKALATEIKTTYEPPTQPNFNANIGAQDVKAQMLQTLKNRK